MWEAGAGNTQLVEIRELIIFRRNSGVQLGLVAYDQFNRLIQSRYYPDTEEAGHRSQGAIASSRWIAVASKER
jgi:hypothetical protein